MTVKPVAPKGHFFRVREVYTRSTGAFLGLKVELRKRKWLLFSESVIQHDAMVWITSDTNHQIESCMRTILSVFEADQECRRRQAAQKKVTNQYVGDYPPKKLP